MAQEAEPSAVPTTTTPAADTTPTEAAPTNLAAAAVTAVSDAAASAAASTSAPTPPSSNAAAAAAAPGSEASVPASEDTKPQGAAADVSAAAPVASAQDVEDEEEEEEDVQVWVGTADGGLTKAEVGRSAVCKIGGFATFPPSATGRAAQEKVAEQARCGVCGDRMFLLAQSFCPVEDMERILYVFACNCSHCHEKKDKSAPWKVFRYQEAVIADEGEEEDGGEEEGEVPVPQAQLWSYPEMAVDTFEEPDTKAATEEEEMRKMRELNGDVSKDITANDLVSMENSGLVNLADEQLAKFQARMAKCPQQVLRWGVGAKPLWLSMHMHTTTYFSI